jgi:hypothetical protein
MKKLASVAGALLIVLVYALLFAVFLAGVVLFVWGVSVLAGLVGITGTGAALAFYVFLALVLFGSLVVKVADLARDIREIGFKRTVGRTFGIKKWK